MNKILINENNERWIRCDMFPIRFIQQIIVKQTMATPIIVINSGMISIIGCHLGTTTPGNW